MKQSHLATATFWLGLLTLFGWQADAQIPRPPMPGPGSPKKSGVPHPPPGQKLARMGVGDGPYGWW